MRRIERLINLIAALLETRRPMTAEEIRSEIAGYDQADHETFRRTFERDKEALRAMGIPLEVTKTDPFSDQTDGYTISKASYYLPDLDLEADEVAALRIAADAILGTPEDAAAGLLKIAINAPATTWEGPRVVWGADVAVEQPALEAFYSALLERVPVTFEYQSAESEEPSARTLEPYGVVHRMGHWYVVGRDLGRQAIRSFKLTRVASDVKTTDGTYEIPPTFRADDHLAIEPWETAVDAPTVATVRFAESLRWWVEQNLPRVSVSETASGDVEAEFSVSNIDALVSWAIGFGELVEIVAPAEARTRMADHLRTFTS